MSCPTKIHRFVRFFLKIYKPLKTHCFKSSIDAVNSINSPFLLVFSLFYHSKQRYVIQQNNKQTESHLDFIIIAMIQFVIDFVLLPWLRSQELDVQRCSTKQKKLQNNYTHHYFFSFFLLVIHSNIFKNREKESSEHSAFTRF